MGLSFARDEVYWLLRHHDNPPPRNNKAKTAEDLVDRHLPELLFYMEELRALVRKYRYSKGMIIFKSIIYNYSFKIS